MRTGDALPIVPQDAPLRDALFAITKAGAGAACVVDTNGALVGLVTDGDIRRRLLQDETALARPVSEAMTRQPITLRAIRSQSRCLNGSTAAHAKIGDLPVLDDDGKPLGMIVLKDLLRAGII